MTLFALQAFASEVKTETEVPSGPISLWHKPGVGWHTPRKGCTPRPFIRKCRITCLHDKALVFIPQDVKAYLPLVLST